MNKDEINEAVFNGEFDGLINAEDEDVIAQYLWAIEVVISEGMADVSEEIYQLAIDKMKVINPIMANHYQAELLFMFYHPAYDDTPEEKSEQLRECIEYGVKNGCSSLIELAEAMDCYEEIAEKVDFNSSCNCMKPR